MQRNARVEMYVVLIELADYKRVPYVYYHSPNNKPCLTTIVIPPLPACWELYSLSNQVLNLHLHSVERSPILVLAKVCTSTVVVPDLNEK